MKLAEKSLAKIMMENCLIKTQPARNNERHCSILSVGTSAVRYCGRMLTVAFFVQVYRNSYQRTWMIAKSFVGCVCRCVGRVRCGEMILTVPSARTQQPSRKLCLQKGARLGDGEVIAAAKEVVVPRNR